MPGYDTSLWFALITRSNIPEPVASKIKAAADKAVQDPVLQKQLIDLGNLPRKPMTNAQIDSFVNEEMRTLTALVKSLNLQAQ